MGHDGKKRSRDGDEAEAEKTRALLKQAESLIAKSGKKDKKDKKHKKHKKHKKEKKKSKLSDSESESSEEEEEEVPPGGIGMADFFKRNTEFRVWMTEKKGKFFDDQSSDENKKLFKKFVKLWNDRKLPDKLYQGVHNTGHDMNAMGRTKHVWGFAKKMDSKTKMELATARDRVESQTETGRNTGIGSDNPIKRVPGVPDEDRARIERLQGKASFRQFRRNEKDTMEELVPKATGREAMIEKRKEVGAKMHGAAKAKEAEMDGLAMDDSSMYGSSTASDFQQRVARKQHWQARKQAERDERVAVIQQNEKSRMDGFMAALGIKPGQKITIEERV
eukprot:TRINITY_DN4375_c0_g1_i1.p1 TRINITY_DN4375_c0_g1~~TRINITY_DN4375_c0_g1_i1.p1  ORF type:complete len:334 (+),score=138.73 TRINITY_DN4375_c0_g1_i1:242-1243(+)